MYLYFTGGAITVDLETAINSILATGVLHNICENHGIPVPENVDDNDDDEEDMEIQNVHHQPEQNIEGATVRATLIRERFT